MICKWRVAGAAVIATAAMVLTACGGGDGGAAATGPAGPSGEPVKGGSATVLLLSEARTLDPALGSNYIVGNAPILNGIFGTLLVTDPETNVIAPSLATFETTDGGTTFDLTLRDGLRFSDGSPFEAAAVKAHWDRVRDPATGSSYGGDVAVIASTEVVSPTVMRATLRSPVPSFGYSVVTTSLNWVPKPEAIAAGGTAFDTNPIGAGPYLLKEWRRQDALVVTRNPAYWDAQAPHLDEITFRPVLDSAQRVNSVVSGGADVALESNWVNVRKAREANLVVDAPALSGGNFLAMNSRRAPFDDVRARQALELAFDPAALNASVYSGAAELPDTMFAPSSPLRSDVAMPQPNKVEAQRLLDELAAEGKPLTFTITVTSSSESRATGEALQAQLSAFTNITVDIEVVEFVAVTALVASKDFDVTPWSAAFVDPDPRLYTVFEGSSPSNMSGVDDPELNAALRTGRESAAGDERKAAYEVVQQRLAETHAAVWTVRNATGVMSGTQVGGVRLYGAGSLLPDEMWIQK